jgi:hypothetical protein
MISREECECGMWSGAERGCRRVQWRKWEESCEKSGIEVRRLERMMYGVVGAEDSSESWMVTLSRACAD